MLTLAAVQPSCPERGSVLGEQQINSTQSPFPLSRHDGKLGREEAGGSGEQEAR